RVALPVASAVSPRAKSLQAARRRLPRGGKAEARLLAFLQQRGLSSDGVKSRARPAPAIQRMRPTRNGRGKGASYADVLQATRPRPRGVAAVAPPLWRFLGPRWIPEGQTYGSGTGSNPAVSGRASAIG